MGLGEFGTEVKEHVFCATQQSNAVLLRSIDGHHDSEHIADEWLRQVKGKRMKKIGLIGLLVVFAVGCQEEVEPAERFCNVTVTNGPASVTTCLQLTCETSACRVRTCATFSDGNRTVTEVSECRGQEQASGTVSSPDNIPGTVLCYATEPTGAAACQTLVR